MTDRPILFSASMVNAIMREIERPGTGKTQTRRMLKCTVPPSPGDDAWLRVSLGKPVEAPKHPHAYLDSYRNRPPTSENPGRMSANWCWWTRDDRQCLPTFKVGYVPGDRLWVRETGRIATDKTAFMFVDSGGRLAPTAPAGSESWAREWKTCPGIHMPRWASRLTLTVTHVRVERLQSISEADAIAEGVDEISMADVPRPATWSRRHDFAQLWDQINGKRDGAAWADNPWVVAVSFTSALRNIDDMLTKPGNVDTSQECVDAVNTTRRHPVSVAAGTPDMVGNG